MLCNLSGTFASIQLFQAYMQASMVVTEITWEQYIRLVLETSPRNRLRACFNGYIGTIVSRPDESFAGLPSHRVLLPSEFFPVRKKSEYSVCLMLKSYVV